MNAHREREGVFLATEAGPADGSTGPRRPPSRPAVAAVAPVRWLRGPATLRPYLAQRDQCLELYHRGREAGLYARVGAGAAEGGAAAASAPRDG